MKQRIRNILCLLRVLWILPGVHWKDQKLQKDLSRWQKQLTLTGKPAFVLAQLLANHREFRNLFIYRNRERIFYSRWVRLLYPPVNTLFIEAGEIGGGLFIQHGFSTMIAAHSIGENCWVNQQVTIGYKDNTQPPIIGNDVVITCGAKVLGNITVGDGAVIGANAVVIKDVEPYAVMVGIPAKVLKWREKNDNQQG